MSLIFPEHFVLFSLCLLLLTIIWKWLSLGLLVGLANL
ncbi:unnamed protein product [Musa acuminata var. zebrina]